ncbi:hypothetical protein [Bauldia sp.]|uniref:hypothetical protein n=1 Tax=Bauldia sp. TaxID=2575872 RepID=UPI003BAD25E7
MIRSTLLRVVVALGVMTLHAAGLRAADDAAAIEQQLRQWTEDFNAGRVEALFALVAPDLIANYRGRPVLAPVGRPAFGQTMPSRLWTTRNAPTTNTST